MKSKTKYKLYDLGARAAAVLPPAVVTLHHFPLFVKQSSGATFSGMALFALFICMIPFWRKIGDVKKFLFSASTPVLWLIVIGVFYLLAEIASAVISIGIAGLGGSCASAVLIQVGNRHATPNERGGDLNES